MPNEEELRSDVGVHNPYALVNIVRAKDKKFAIDWIDLMKEDRADKEELKKNKVKKALYEDLAPLYNRNVSITDALPRIDNATEDQINTFYSKLFSSAECDLLFSTAANLLPDANLQSCSKISVPMEDQMKTYTDPIQGAAADCFFIAAICSLAWVNRKKLIATPVNSSDLINTNYKIKFYPSTDLTEVTQDLFKDTSGNIAFAHSGQDEIWPGVFEKAYAKYNFSDTYLGCPDIRKFAGGNPITALSHLTGKTPQYKNNAEFSSGYDVYDFINRYNCYMKKTKYPMTAYTYNPPITIPPAGVIYSNDTIVANHSYSILGTFTDGGTYYVVLRNPYGPIKGDPDSPPIYPGVWTQVGDYQFDGGRPQSGSGYVHDIQLSPDDGIFALEANYFKNYFQAFGWVQI